MPQSKMFPLSDKGTVIRTQYSFCNTKPPTESVLVSKSDTFRNSDINVIKMKDYPSIIDSGCVNRNGLAVKDNSYEEYYKRYEHDDVPERDSSYPSNDSLDNGALTLNEKELTNSDLDNLEIRVFKNMSKELQTDESSTNTHEYNIQLFKTTVQEILDKFYSDMYDFELYKKKFHEILSKNKENIVEEMEDFIKEMIQNIISSESCIPSGRNTTKLPSKEIGKEDSRKDESRTFSHDTGEYQRSTTKTLEAYKNENYLTDSTFEDGTNNTIKSENKDKTCNIYLIEGKPCIEIKMDERNLLSEINIRNRHIEEIDTIASADNVKSIAAKRLQMTNYMRQTERQNSDKVIPVKITNAKKDIHCEDYPDDPDQNNKSFIYKICNFLCKKLRKTSFG